MSKQRLEWLDALRGFTMFMVVTNHIYGFGFATDTKYSMFMSVCLLFRMPLFFFISGFLAYKTSFSWSMRDTGQLIAKKMRVQIVPTVVFMTAYIALVAKDFWSRMEYAWTSPTKGGYWFTMVLLEMFLVYYAVCWTSKQLCRTGQPVLTDGQGQADGQSQASISSQPRSHTATNISLIILWLISLFAYATLYMPSWFSWYKVDFWKITSITELARYFHFFLLGNLVHRYWSQVQRLLDSKWFFPLLIAIAFLGAGDYLKWHHLRMQWANLPRTLSMYALVLIIVAFFRHYSSWFTKETHVGKTLQYIGVRTLDIYLIHYFFIPKLPAAGVWFKAHQGNFVLEGTTAMALAMLVVAFSILTSHVLRVSPFLKKWLFGRE
ncbi:MAG: acyltransferase [Bacteroidales bacterium]|nr:acyltransferase [Bacteroidales bacterium]